MSKPHLWRWNGMWWACWQERDYPLMHVDGRLSSFGYGLGAITWNSLFRSIR